MSVSNDGAGREAERFVDADRGVVLGEHVQDRRLAARLDAGRDRAHEPRREPALAGLGVGAHRARSPCSPAGARVRPSSRRGRRPARERRAQVRAELDGPLRRTGPGRVRSTSASMSATSAGAERANDVVGLADRLGRDHLQRVHADRDLPVRGHVDRRGPEQHRARRPGPTSSASASQASGPTSSGSAANARDVGLVAQREAAALGELGPADRSARAKRGCRAAPRPRWCHGDAHRARDFRPSRPHRRRRLHDRRRRDRARAGRRRCATRSGGSSASCTSSRRGPRPRVTRPGGCTTCSPRIRCSRRCRCTRACCPIVERVLDRGCLLSGMTAIDIGPGEHAQPMHGDDIVMSRHLQRPHAPMMVTSMWALDDFTADERRHALRSRLAPLRRARPTNRARSTASRSARSRCRPAR